MIWGRDSKGPMGYIGTEICNASVSRDIGSRFLKELKTRACAKVYQEITWRKMLCVLWPFNSVKSGKCVDNPLGRYLKASFALSVSNWRRWNEYMGILFERKKLFYEKLCMIDN